MYFAVVRLYALILPQFFYMSDAVHVTLLTVTKHCNKLIPTTNKSSTLLSNLPFLHSPTHGRGVGTFMTTNVKFNNSTIDIYTDTTPAADHNNRPRWSQPPGTGCCVQHTAAAAASALPPHWRHWQMWWHHGMTRQRTPQSDPEQHLSVDIRFINKYRFTTQKQWQHFIHRQRCI